MLFVMYGIPKKTRMLKKNVKYNYNSYALMLEYDFES